MVLVSYCGILKRKRGSCNVKKRVASAFCRGRGVAAAMPMALAASQIRLGFMFVLILYSIRTTEQNSVEWHSSKVLL